jgi:hypothetical protein
MCFELRLSPSGSPSKPERNADATTFVNKLKGYIKSEAAAIPGVNQNM